jgi:hypothetical protein
MILNSSNNLNKNTYYVYVIVHEIIVKFFIYVKGRLIWIL